MNESISENHIIFTILDVYEFSFLTLMYSIVKRIILSKIAITKKTIVTIPSY
ncbi:hypothetical protein GCM10008018_61700 [Paenibacillus marchantiophytorum]|uniref:Uncharacterized protein n=1 Tax=Paenibacillus marchantiophytorum TaxID=1619310 RepID=A0ABQ1FF29_9BACL|nr:hypothetical protein GCM10008018_61700 [Paenibacillus marchantiophytorum]